MRFTDQSFSIILEHIQSWFQSAAIGDTLRFEVPHPDAFHHQTPGTRQTFDGQPHIFRPLNCWLSLAERMSCRCWLPRAKSPFSMELTFEKLAPNDLHAAGDTETKYGEASHYWQLDKREWPEYVLDFQQALRQMTHEDGARVLEIGCHRGDGYTLLRDLLPQQQIHYQGFDASHQSIAFAQKHYAKEQVTFTYADLNQWESLSLTSYDLVLALGVLHVTTLNGKDLLMNIVRNHLKKRAMIIATFPNCRLQTSGLTYGAKMKNYSESDLSVLVREVAFYRRYLHGKGFRTRLFGKHYWFLTAWRD